MTRVLAFVDDSPCAAGVRRTAVWIAELLGAAVDVMRAEPNSGDRDGATTPIDGSARPRIVRGPTVSTLRTSLEAGDVETAVVGARAVDPKPTVLGHVAEALLTTARGPLVVVPPTVAAPATERPHILVPLDGDDATSASLLPHAERLAASGAAISIVHVYDAESLPPFIASAEDVDILAAELAQRHLPGLARHCRLRIGDAPTEVLRAVDAERPDAVLVAWHQVLAPARAEVLRRLLHEAHVPLVVVPVAPAE